MYLRPRRSTVMHRKALCVAHSDLARNGTQLISSFFTFVDSLLIATPPLDRVLLRADHELQNTMIILYFKLLNTKFKHEL